MNGKQFENKPAHDLHVFMDQITTEMASEYQRIYARSTEDPGTAGDEGEENWATLFREWLPPTYHVETKGRLISHDGRMSPQVDIVILKPSYPKKLLEKKVWMAGGIAAAFECKNTLTAAHVTSSVERCAIFKSLFLPRIGTPRAELRSPLVYGLLSHSHSWKGQRSNPIDNIRSALMAASEQIDQPRNLLDLICVADLACWHLVHIAFSEAKWTSDPVGYEKAFGAPGGPMTTHTCASRNSNQQRSEFRPVGALIAELVENLAWSEPSIRDIADYYNMANLQGNSSGTTRPWPYSIYSNVVHAGIAAGRLTNGVAWDEWAVTG
jgi:hypothetical protein